MSLHPHNIEQKTEVMVEHFRKHVKHRLDDRAKAMVVTSSRLHAVRYKLAFDRYLKRNGYTDIRPLVAFSGTVKDPETGLEYTEPGMNTDIVTGKPISEAQLPERFDSSDYQVLLVANKYQTGFDQPRLSAMYVDKRLDGVQAVQTLSRLNRKIPGKDEPFVLDFVNPADDIYRAFKPYYDATSLQESSDISKLEALKHELDQAQVYHSVGSRRIRQYFLSGARGSEGIGSRRDAEAAAACSRSFQSDSGRRTAARISGKTKWLHARVRVHEPDRAVCRS